MTRIDHPRLPYLGFGLGLRTVHFDAVLEQRPEVDWFEVLTENFMVEGGKPRHYLHRIREHYPLVMHGVSLSIGSTEPLDTTYLKALGQLAREVEPAWISDHLCFTSASGINSHDLLPLPYTDEAIGHIAKRIDQVQNTLGRQILIENLSSYLSYNHSQMSEWEFLSAVASEADCLLLIDINNIYVSACNHQFDPMQYLDGLPAKRIQQFHLAGHTIQGECLIDTHDQPVCQDVWQLYQQCVERFGSISTMIERDDHIPELNVLLDELDQARQIYRQVTAEHAVTHTPS